MKPSTTWWYYCSWHTMSVHVQLLSHVWLFATPWTTAHQAPLASTISQSLLKFRSTELVILNHLILCHLLLLLPSIFPRTRVFSNELALRIRWPKYWSFSFSISLSNEYSGLISFRIDWLDLLAVQGTLKSLLQHHNSKALVHRCSAFSMVQPSHPYMTTGKNIALTIWTFVGKVISLLFNMLSRFVIALLPRSKQTQLVPEAMVTEPSMGLVTWPWLVLWFCTNKNDLDRRAKRVEQSGWAAKMQRSWRRERKERQANGWDEPFPGMREARGIKELWGLSIFQTSRG